MIDVIIPTMWLAGGFADNLYKYLGNSRVQRVIVIDNNPSNRPESVTSHPKLELVTYGRNIYVNPAWNEGYLRSSADIIAIINDDISVDASIFDMVTEFSPKPGDIIGVNLRGRQNNYKIDDHIDTEEAIVKLNYNPSQPIGGQAWAFGICMFMHRSSYSRIPSLYQVWYGDDYLVQKAKAVYAINSNRIKGKISETLERFRDPNSDVSKRIELDSRNLLKYGDFENARDWDIPKNIVAKFEQDRKLIKRDVFEREYAWARTNPSDINENVHILHELASTCDSVVEFGVRTGVSTRAFLATKTKLRSYDIVHNQTVQQMFDTAKLYGKNAEYIIADTLKLDIEPADMLFIDTLHTYPQLKQELARHSKKIKRYIAFHDTYTYGLVGEIRDDRKGLLSAILEFLRDNSEWRIHTYRTNNNGMMVLERVN